MPRTARAPIRPLLDLVDRAFDRRAWHGPNLRASIRGLTHEQAAWRPAAGRHCIWEIALHAAYWKYVVRRALTGEARGSFPRKGSDWLRLPAPADAAAWRADVELLEEEHRKLRETVAALRRVDAKAEFRIQGAAFHDVYHAGQIRLVKRMLRARGAGG